MARSLTRGLTADQSLFFKASMAASIPVKPAKPRPTGASMVTIN